MPNNPHQSVPDRLANRYRLIEPVGEGAHATTWRGWDERLERPVAIKILHQRLAQDPIFLQRFQAEAKAAASVRQGNVVDVYDFGQEGDALYIVMQFVDGETLKALVQRTAPMAPRDVRRIIGNVLDGLQAIHHAGIVHRDIKPQNVLIGTDGVARVTDFGVAEVDATAGLTGEGLTIGTVDYMAPEQAQGLPLTASADLYATGVMLYEMLTGTLPFQGKNVRDTMLQHINARVVPPSVRMPERGISPAMDAVIVQSLAKDPARRFGTARAMKQAVGQALASNSPQAQTAATSVIPAQQRAAPAPQPTYQTPPPQDEGAGLNGAFRGLLILLLIGFMGVVAWGALQLLDSDRFDFNLPSFGNGQEQSSPTPTPTVPLSGTEDVIEPIDSNENQPENQEQVIPTEPPPVAPEPTTPPEPTETQVIEPIEPEQTEETIPTDPPAEESAPPTDEPAIEPAG